jgi:hypothetical protein
MHKNVFKQSLGRIGSLERKKKMGFNGWLGPQGKSTKSILFYFLSIG